MLLASPTDYETLRRDFRWRIPSRYNIAVDICDRWASAEPERTAIIEVTQDWRVTPVSFGALRSDSNRLANALRAQGVERGDRIAILLPQGRAVLTAHLAAYKLGAIAVPLAALFGVDALAYRLSDAAAKVLITDAAGLAKIALIAEPLAGAGARDLDRWCRHGGAQDWHRAAGGGAARISRPSIPLPTTRR